MLEKVCRDYITHCLMMKWIASQPELLNYLKYMLFYIGYIEYDKTTGTWKGIDVHD